MRTILAVLAALALIAAAMTAAAAKPGAKNTRANSAACKSIRSDFHHKGGGYIPAGVTCGRKRTTA